MKKHLAASRQAAKKTGNFTAHWRKRSVVFVDRKKEIDKYLCRRDKEMAK